MDELTANERMLLSIMRAGIFAAAAQGLEVRTQWAVGLQGDTPEAAAFAAGIAKSIITRAEAERAVMDATRPVDSFWENSTDAPEGVGAWDEEHGR